MLTLKHAEGLHAERATSRALNMYLQTWMKCRNAGRLAEEQYSADLLFTNVKPYVCTGFCDLDTMPGN